MPVIINGTTGVNVASTTGVINLLGSTSGAITLQANAIAGTNTITLPASTGTVALTSGLPASEQLCKAWAKFNGTTATIIQAYGISSITKNTTGDYTVNFTTTQANANYAAITGFTSTTGGSWYAAVAFGQSGSPYYVAPTTNAFKVLTIRAYDNTVVDSDNVQVAVFGA